MSGFGAGSFKCMLIYRLVFTFFSPSQVLQDLTTGTQSAEVTPVMEPTFGFGGRWESFDDLFRLLRLLGLRTVVLRNHEELASNAQPPGGAELQNHTPFW